MRESYYYKVEKAAPSTFTHALSLQHRQLFTYSFVTDNSHSKPIANSAKLILISEKNMVVPLIWPNARPVTYSIGEGGIENSQLTLVMAQQVQDLCDFLEIDMPHVSGFGGREAFDDPKIHHLFLQS